MMASGFGAVFAVVFGGAGTLFVSLLWALGFPQLRRIDTLDVPAGAAEGVIGRGQEAGKLPLHAAIAPSCSPALHKNQLQKISIHVRKGMVVQAMRPSRCALAQLGTGRSKRWAPCTTQRWHHRPRQLAVELDAPGIFA